MWGLQSQEMRCFQAGEEWSAVSNQPEGIKPDRKISPGQSDIGVTAVFSRDNLVERWGSLQLVIKQESQGKPEQIAEQ